MKRSRTLAENLQKIRQIRGFSQESLAKSAGVSYNTVAKIESGNNTNPTLDTILKLIRALGVHISELVS